MTLSSDDSKTVKTKLPERAPWPNWLRVAALAGIMLSIAVLTVWYSRSVPEDVLAHELVSAHIRSLMDDHLTDVLSTDQHSVKPWFDGRLDFAPPVVDLTSQGFSLIGGRLDYLLDRPVASLVYKRRQHVINVFVFPQHQAPELERLNSQHGYNIIGWQKGGFTFWAVSDLNSDELMELSQSYRNELK